MCLGAAGVLHWAWTLALLAAACLWRWRYSATICPRGLSGGGSWRLLGGPRGEDGSGMVFLSAPAWPWGEGHTRQTEQYSTCMNKQRANPSAYTHTHYSPTTHLVLIGELCMFSSSSSGERQRGLPLERSHLLCLLNTSSLWRGDGEETVYMCGGGMCLWEPKDSTQTLRPAM